MGRTMLVVAVTTAAVLGALSAQVAALIYLAHGPWHERLSLVLQLLALYGIGLGFLSRSQVVRRARFCIDDMTSPRIGTFVAGNFRFVALLFSTVSVGLSPDRTTRSSLALGCLGGALLMGASPFVILYAAFHLLILAPLSYPAYLMASGLVESVRGSARDLTVTRTSRVPGSADSEPGLQREEEMGEVQLFSVREFVDADPASAKSFLIGLPAAVLSLITKLVGLFLSG